MEKGYKSTLERIFAVLAVAVTLFQAYTSATLPLQTFAQRSIHLAFLFPMGFMLLAEKNEKKFLRVLYYICALLSAVVFIYVFINRDVLTLRVTSMLPLDFIFGVLTIILVLFLTYKQLGIWMPLIALVFVAYSYIGPHLTGIFKFRAISLQRYLSTVYFSEEGLFGTCTGVSATYVFMFILFGEFLVKYGAGQFIIDLAQSVFGRFRGGSVKIAVIAAGLFGMVSGSSPVIVAGTGPFTIPMIKKAGYDPEYAGGVVAAGSVGGLIMPPVMGAAAFIMADMLKIPYGEICIKAAPCAIMYFGTLFLMADIRALSQHDTGIPKDQIPNGIAVLRSGWFNLLSIFVLVYLLCFLQWSASKAAFWAIVVLYVSYLIKGFVSHSEMTVSGEILKLRDVCVQTGKGMITVCAACVCAGIIIGSMSATGLNLRLSSLLVTLAGGRMLLLLLLAMVGNIILGMGLPPLSVYIIMSLLVAPAIVNMGLAPLAAHMFIFYFGIMASITPPVGIAFYVSAGLANADPMKTGFSAWRFALAGFIIPFVFAYSPGLLLLDTAPNAVWAIFTTAIGLVMMAFGLEGYIYGIGNINRVLRVILIVGAVITIVPEKLTTLIGIGILAVVIVCGLAAKRRSRAAV